MLIKTFDKDILRYYDDPSTRFARIDFLCIIRVFETQIYLYIIFEESRIFSFLILLTYISLNVINVEMVT